MAENPPISISPIAGEDFTQRLLPPLQETELTLLLRQGVDIDLLLRLMAGELCIFRGVGDIAYYNSPSDEVGYPFFRRTVLHLSHLQDTNQLYVEPLVLEREWLLPFSTLSGEGFGTLEKSYQVTYDSATNQYILKKHVVGRIVITNYDPDLLGPEERLDLEKKAERWPPNDLLVDIRPGFPGGELPIQGDFRLRSFHVILNFLGCTMEEEPEYHVDPNPLTGWSRKIRYGPLISLKPPLHRNRLSSRLPSKGSTIRLPINPMTHGIKRRFDCSINFFK